VSPSTPLQPADAGNVTYHLNAHTYVDAATLVTVGYSARDLAFLCGSVAVPYSIVNLEQGAPCLVCTNLCESIDGAWPRLKNSS